MKVLFVCIHNSARSQMAEAFVNHYANGKIEAFSAGLTPGKLNPLVVKVMAEIGIDISGNESKSIERFINDKFDYVVTVCDEGNAARCPSFLGVNTKLHWSFLDPSSFTGSEEERLLEIRIIRDQIKDKIMNWMKKIHD